MRRQQLSHVEADALADRFEKLRPKDLGVGRPGPGARGRPSLDAGDQHSPKVQARVTRELYEKLNQRARAGRTTVSAVVREAIEKL
jgi:Ribbon-helix-helix protein, copG family